MSSSLTSLLSQFPKTLFCSVSLAPLTSWKVGGVAAFLFMPESIEELSVFLKVIPATTPLYFLGLGSNLLIADGLIEAVFISTKNLPLQLQKLDEGFFSAGANCVLAQLARHTINEGFTGLEPLAGIPGTVGGALAMNAGAHGKAIWNFVEKVQTIDRAGNIIERKRASFDIGYRSVKGLCPEGEWFLNAILLLPEGDRVAALENMEIYLNKRRLSQPLDYPNAGSVFKNPEGDFAARLIELSGLKGYRVGGAVVSPKHANFILNDQNAMAKDIWQLITHIKETVKKDHGILLEEEIKFIGGKK